MRRLLLFSCATDVKKFEALRVTCLMEDGRVAISLRRIWRMEQQVRSGAREEDTTTMGLVVVVVVVSVVVLFSPMISEGAHKTRKK